MSNTTIMETGYACLIEKLGTAEVEKFVVAIKNDHFDYTEWRREYFGKMEPGQFSREAVEYAKTHPHKGRGRRL